MKPTKNSIEQRTCSKCSYQWWTRVPNPQRCPGCQMALRKDVDYVNPSQLRKARKVKLFLVGYKCEDCGASGVRLNAHHLDKSKDNHALDNLRIVCSGCHRGNYHTKENPKRQERVNLYVKVADRKKPN